MKSLVGLVADIGLGLCLIDGDPSRDELRDLKFMRGKCFTSKDIYG
jgi:hypothetical protein